MAHTLRLTYGGSTINLNSGSITMQKYVPKTPNLSTIDTNTILVDGGGRTLTTRRNVTETAEIQIADSDASNIQGAKHDIQTWLMYAERYSETLSGSRVFVEYAPDSISSSIYRSELLGGKVSLVDESLDWRWTQSRHVPMEITWTRRYFWEGDEISIPTWNANLSPPDATNTCPVVNQSSSGAYDGTSAPNNWVQIDASSVTGGEIPSPAKIVIQNDSGGDLATRSIYLFHRIMPVGETYFPNVIEGESGSAQVSGSIVAGATYSSGNAFDAQLDNYLGLTLGTYYWVWSYDIPAASMSHYTGGYYQIMARIFGVNNSYSKFVVAIPDGVLKVDIAESPAIETDDSFDLVPFGSINMTPQITETQSPGITRLVLEGTASACGNYRLDFVQICPTDGYKYLRQEGFQVVDGDVWVVDDIENALYIAEEEDGAGSYGNLAGHGKMFVYPNRNQRTYLLVAYDSEAYDITKNFKMAIKYRPRRLTI